MRSTILKNQLIRKKRAWRIRKRLHGTASRPRLSVIKSNKHIQVQLIDDDAHATLGAVSTNKKEFRNTEFGRKNKAAARNLGEYIAKVAQEKNIKEVVFDRGPFNYHGILSELADAARAAGLQF